MINALYEPFPEHITVEGEEYPIITDFRDWLCFADLMRDSDVSKRDKVYLLSDWFETRPKKINGKTVNALFDFYYARELEPDADDDDDEAADDVDDTVIKPPVLDWRIDSRYILGDFRHYYDMNLLPLIICTGGNSAAFSLLFLMTHSVRRVWRIEALTSAASRTIRNAHELLGSSAALPYHTKMKMI